MTSTIPPLLDLRGYISALRIHDLSSCLEETWLVTMGRPTGDLVADLEASRRWFDPVAQGQRLRRELDALPGLPPDLADPGDPFTLEIGQERRLVTPEGRCALDLLRGLDDAVDGYVITDAHVIPYERLLGATYRSWSRHRIMSVLDLLAGATKPLQVPAAGVVIALLVDRCTSPERALVRYVAGPGGSHVVEQAFFTAVNAFADVLAPSRKGKRDQRLISGWMLYEARRRLGSALVLEDSSDDSEGRVWIRAAEETEVVNVVARDLVRGHRARATPDRFGHAFDSLVIALREELPSLAAFGMAHERPANTDRLRSQLIRALTAHLESDEPSDLAV